MKVLLVDNFIVPEEGSSAVLDVHPHLGLLALASAMERSGHTARIIDPKKLVKAGQLSFDTTLYEHAAAEILASHPDVVEFTSTGLQLPVRP